MQYFIWLCFVIYYTTCMYKHKPLPVSNKPHHFLFISFTSASYHILLLCICTFCMKELSSSTRANQATVVNAGLSNDGSY